MLGGNRLLILCTLAVLISAPLAATNLVTNGGFETTDWTGWTLTYSPVDPGYCSGLWPYAAAHSGLNGAGFGNVCSGDYGDTISQVINTVPGTAYTFTFWLSSDDGGDNGQQALWDGTVVLGPLVNFQQYWTQYSFTETATSSTTTIEFAGYNVYSLNSLDDVSVEGEGVVPEPSSLVLIGVGLAGLGFLRRRRG